MLALALTSACEEPAAEPSDAPVCRVAARSIPLPQELRETSGAALSRRFPGIVWSHNDSSHRPVLYALDANSGALRGAVDVTGAQNRDWEDLAIGPCGDADCIYISDTGDNDAERDSVVIYRVPEPAAGEASSAPAEAFPARFPEGPKDAEALFLLAPDRLFLITKGRHGPITLYRYPPPLRPGEMVTLERVRDLAATPELRGQMATAAAATPDGEWVLVRTYRSLLFYRTDELLEGGAEPFAIDVSGLEQPQSEGLDIDANGSVLLTSESDSRESAAVAAALSCELP